MRLHSVKSRGFSGEAGEGARPTQIPGGFALLAVGSGYQQDSKAVEDEHQG